MNIYLHISFWKKKKKKHIFSGLAKLYFPIFLWIWNLIPFLFVSHEADQGFYFMPWMCSVLNLTKTWAYSAKVILCIWSGTSLCSWATVVVYTGVSQVVCTLPYRWNTSKWYYFNTLSGSSAWSGTVVPHDLILLWPAVVYAKRACMLLLWETCLCTVFCSGENNTTRIFFS